MTDEQLLWLKCLSDAVGAPSGEALKASRHRVEEWFAGAAPLIRWDVVETPVGPLYLAANARGVCRVELGGTPDAFLAALDPLARTVRDAASLAAVTAQLREYFAGQRTRFDLPLDMDQMRPFQKRVLQAALIIPAGTVWTYGQVARVIGQPQASRAVGSALGSNPIPIIIPCHRVIGSDGRLHGYGTGNGLPTKRWLLEFEGAL
jgi:methylated-DNA-[protein]-cysteine S-methyltransferase